MHSDDSNESWDRERFWRDLIGRFRHRLAGWFRRTPCPPRDIEDLIAEVWALAAEKERALRATTNPWDLLSELARAVWANRKLAIEHELIDADAHRLEPEYAAVTPIAARSENISSDEQAADASLAVVRSVLNGALARLPRREREVTTLHWLGDESDSDGTGFEYSQIANRLGIKESAARQYAMQARRRLLTFFEDDGDADWLTRWVRAIDTSS